MDGGVLYEGIREGLINCVTYCDYVLNGVLRIDRRSDCIIFRNPGLLRIDVERIYDGDFTNARNRTIQKLFRMIGYGDNIGSGFQKILSAWKSLGYARPELKEFDDVKEVWLTLPLQKDSQINPQINPQINSTDNKLAINNIIDKSESVAQTDSQINSQINSNKSLSEIQRQILNYMISHPMSSIEDISKALNEKVETIRYQRRLMSNVVKTVKIGSNKTGTWEITFIS